MVVQLILQEFQEYTIRSVRMPDPERLVFTGGGAEETDRKPKPFGFAIVVIVAHLVHDKPPGMGCCRRTQWAKMAAQVLK